MGKHAINNVWLHDYFRFFEIPWAPSGLGMGPSTCSLDARSVLGVFDGARARVLESEHMLVLARARG